MKGTRYLLKLVGIYDRAGDVAYFQGSCMGDFRFVADRDKATLLTYERAEHILQSKGFYLKLFGATDMVTEEVPVVFGGIYDEIIGGKLVGHFIVYKGRCDVSLIGNHQGVVVGMTYDMFISFLEYYGYYYEATDVDGVTWV